MSGDFVRLGAAVAGFCEREPRALSPDEVEDQVVALSRCIDVLQRERAQLVAVCIAAKQPQRQGFGTDIDWLRHSARMSGSDAAAVVVVAAHLDQLPRSSAALQAGDIGFAHLVHMARNAEFIAQHRTGTFDEAPLLERAVEESVGRFRHTCLNQRHVQDPDGVVQHEAAAVERREATWSAPLEDGTTWLNLLLDTATATMVRADTRRRAGRLGPDDHRTRARREADAIIERLLGQGGAAVEVVVSCTPDTLQGLSGAPAAELEYTEPISGEMLRRLACNATFTKILLDESLIPVAAATSRRVPTKKERTAMDLQQRHCRGRGCHRPASECSPHHVVWYSRSRRTRLAELILLCPHHHWMVHEGGWNVALKAGGEVVFIPPFARGPTRTAVA